MSTPTKPTPLHRRTLLFKVVWPCLMKGLPFKAMVAVPGAKGRAGTTAPEFRAKFPLGTVPAIEYGDTRITESAAILSFLADTHGWSDLYPTERRARVKVDEYLHWHHSGVRSLANAHFAPRMRPDLVIDASARAAASAKSDRSLQLVEEAFLGGAGGGGFIGGRACASVADLLCYSEVACLGPRFGDVIDLSAAKLPRIAAWMDRMAELPHHDAVFAAAAAVGKLDDASQPPLLERLAPSTKAGLAAIAAAAAASK